MEHYIKSHNFQRKVNSTFERKTHTETVVRPESIESNNFVSSSCGGPIKSKILSVAILKHATEQVPTIYNTPPDKTGE